MNINDMKVRRDALLAEARDIAEVADAAGRDLTDDERGKYEAIMADAKSVRNRIERAAALDAEAGLLAADAPAPIPDATIGMSTDEVRAFSFIKAIRAAASDDWSDAGLEAEASRAAEKLLPNGRQGEKGFVVPHDVLIEGRDVTKGTGTGDQIVGTDLLAGSFIEGLRNRMVVKQAGARVMAGLVGDVAIPKASSGATAHWVGEDGAPTESTSAWTQVPLTPKTVAAWEDISRLLLKQSTPDAEALVRDDISSALALAIDLAALHGTGADEQPTGIAATSGIGSVAGGDNGLAAAWSHVVDLETEVAQDNADIGSLAYITNAKVRGKAKQTAKVASTDSHMLWAEGSTPLNGYRTLVSNQVASDLDKGTSTGVCSAIFYGNWNDLIVGMWGGLDVLVDPYTLSTTGQVRLVAFQSVDVAVRYAQSFAAMLDALTA